MKVPGRSFEVARSSLPMATIDERMKSIQRLVNLLRLAVFLAMPNALPAVIVPNLPIT